MNKGLIATFIVLVVLGLGSYFLISSNKTEETTREAMPEKMSMESEKMSDSSMDTKMFSGKLADLLSSGDDYTCEYKYTDDDGSSSEGMMYVTSRGQRMSGDFAYTDVEGSTTRSYMINDGTYIYTWSAEAAQGYKMLIPDGDFEAYLEDAENMAADYSNDENSNPLSMNEMNNVEYDCKSWNVDESVFTPPTDVDFVDFSAQMEGLMDSLQGDVDGDSPAPGLDCSVCDNVPAGTSRDQCLQALGC